MENKKKCNFTLVIDAMPPAGAPKLCYDMISSLDPELFKASVVTLFFKGELGEELEKKGISVFDLNIVQPFKIKSLIRTLPILSDFISSQGSHFIHAHLTASGLYTAVTAKYMKLPAIYTVHGMLPQQYMIRTLDILVRNSYSYLTGVSDCVTDETKKLMWFSKREIQRIYNGIDTAYWKPQDLSIKKNGTNFLMVSNFTKEKDHLTLLKAFSKLKKEFTSISLTLIGDGIEINNCRKWVKENSVNTIEFCGPIRDIKPYLEKADIFVQSSHTESFGLAALEAMSMGLPVIASKVEGLEEVITDGESGLLVQPNDAGALESAMRELVKNQDKRDRLGKCARMRAIHKFSLVEMTNRYQKLFQAVISNGVTLKS